MKSNCINHLWRESEQCLQSKLSCDPGLDVSVEEEGGGSRCEFTAGDWVETLSVGGFADVFEKAAPKLFLGIVSLHLYATSSLHAVSANAPNSCVSIILIDAS